jgi:hypothetical protein
MRQWLRKLETIAAAAAFAEEGQWKMARDILNEPQKRREKREADRARQARTRVRAQSYRA